MFSFPVLARFMTAMSLALALDALPPVIEYVIQSNEGPSAYEQSFIEGFIADSDALPSSLEEEVQESRQSLQTTLSPIRRLPKEILLYEIFRWLPPLDVLDLLDPHWVISQVCHEWRDFALSLPSFWSHFVVDIEHADESYCPVDSAALLQIVLDRSQDHDIDFSLYTQAIDLDEMDDDSRQQEELLTELLTVIMKYPSKWKRADLGQIPMTLAISLSVLCSGKLTHLEDVTIYVLPGFYSRGQPICAFQDAPISTLKLSHLPLRLLSGMEPCFIETLTLFSPDLHVEESTTSLYRTLQSLPNLTSFDLGGYRSCGQSGIPPDVPFVHRCLTSLSTTDTRHFRHVSLPSLRKLQVTIRIFDNEFLGGCPSIVHLLQNSECRLTRLVLANCNCTDALSDVFRLTPHLEELEVSFDDIRCSPMGFFKYFVDLLAKPYHPPSSSQALPSPSTHLYIPHLKALSLYTGNGDYPWTFFDSCVARMLVARHKVGLASASFNRHACGSRQYAFPALKEEDIQELRALKAAGLDLLVRWHYGDVLADEEEDGF